VFYSKVWFNTPQFAVAERRKSKGIFGIKPDVLINFLSNEPPFRYNSTLQIPLSLLCGGSFGFKKMGMAFSVPFKKEPKKNELPQALIFFKMFGKAIWLMGLVGVITGVIAMLINLEDKSAIGPNLAVSILPMLYCAIMHIVIIIPFTAFIKKHLGDC
jgi:uncharacterized membrane protein